MSTATELIEQFLEHQPVKDSQATQTQLMIVSAGFTLYPTYSVDGQLYAYGVAAPRAPDYRHAPQLIVSKDSVANHPQLNKHEGPNGTWVFDVAGYDMSLAGSTHRSGASADALQMVPEFESLCCGLSLPKHWRTSDVVDAWLAFEPGKVFAIPDNCSVQESHWTDCNSNEVRHQHITSWTGYIPDNWNEPRVECTPRARRDVEPASIEFNRGTVFMAFGNFPTKDIDPADLGIDVAHIYSMLQLSDIGSPPPANSERVVSFTLGIGSCGPPLPRKPPDSPSQLPKWLSDYLYETENFGRPHCGARQWKAPGL
jgi:hypothetical protein